jgi:uncharacterized lipoprotein YddW (UPF0748 family)
MAGAYLILAACTHVPTKPEFRGVWVATVNNLDWPSRPGLPPDEQKRELVALFDCFAATGLNAVILHVRPNADAFYRSEIEPWSDYLTGELGTDPGYDPLAFAIEEAHSRGLELHAWLNPYRARHPLSIPTTSPAHIARTHPELVYPYGRFFWLDPGAPEVREHVVRVVRDIVRRYDVDAIHFDDYFYPYPENDLSFPDEATYSRYGGGLSRSEWRRKNVDDFVRQVARAIEEEKPSVRFGISPFGIWRPGHPRGVRGFDAYEGIYADSLKWLQSGWVDYLAPQLYWALSAPQQRFDHLLRWWRRRNRLRRDIYPGLGAHRVASGRPNAFTADEIVNQIARTRRERGIGGWIVFSARVLMQDRGGLTDRIEAINRGAPPRRAGRR